MSSYLASTFSNANDTMARALEDFVDVRHQLIQGKRYFRDETDVDNARGHARLHGNEPRRTAHDIHQAYTPAQSRALLVGSAGCMPASCA